jgi:hypothetical protein
MNKTFKQLLVLILALVTVCGTALAAPHGGNARAPQHAPKHQAAKRPPAPKKPALKKHAHHRPALKLKHHTQHNGHHHGGKNNGWVTFGAAVLGGLLGGLLGACN